MRGRWRVADFTALGQRGPTSAPSVMVLSRGPSGFTPTSRAPFAPSPFVTQSIPKTVGDFNTTTCTQAGGKLANVSSDLSIVSCCFPTGTFQKNGKETYHCGGPYGTVMTTF